MIIENKQHNILLLSILICLNAIGLFSGLFIDDPALYANISKQMVVRGDWLNLYVNGKDWLDKPHFPFWCGAASMTIFGFTAFAYKLPAFIFFLISLFYTFKLARLFYSIEIAWISIIILSSSFHIIIFNNDVRAEPYLLGLMTGGLYHLILTYRRFSLGHLIIGALFCACAWMTKGVFALIPIGIGLAMQAIYFKEPKKIFHWQWILAVIFIGVFILPEIYAVYKQFDLHPDKVVFGKTNVSGVKFFLWDSQFGRFVNSLPTIKGRGDIFFFFHTIIYAYMPWGIIVYAAVGWLLIQLIRKREVSEIIFFSAFLVLFALFSLSKFQLPHYINLVFPYTSIIIAVFLVQSALNRFLIVIQYIFVIGIAIALPVVYLYINPGRILLYFVLNGCILIVSGYLVFKIKNTITQLLFVSVTVAIMLGLFMNLFFYPLLLKQQRQMEVVNYLNEISDDITLGTNVKAELIEYYSKFPLMRLNPQDIIHYKSNTDLIAYIDLNAKSILDSSLVNYQLIGEFQDLKSTKLNFKFFNPDTRNSTLRTCYLVRIKNE